MPGGRAIVDLRREFVGRSFRVKGFQVAHSKQFRRARFVVTGDWVVMASLKTPSSLDAAAKWHHFDIRPRDSIIGKYCSHFFNVATRGTLLNVINLSLK